MIDPQVVRIYKTLTSHRTLRWVFFGGIAVVVLLLMLGVSAVWGLVAWLADHAGR